MVPETAPLEKQSPAPRRRGRVIPITPVASDSLYAAQEKVYPRSVKGRFATWRWICVWLTQVVFYGLPWLQWHERQAVVFDLAARKFYIFGLVLWPQDFIYLTGLLVISALALFLFTAIAGRLWCGYACPQTVYTEIFLWIERRIEGDRHARMKLDDAQWSASKLARKSGKQLAWIMVALWTGFTFVGYFTPIHTLAGEIAHLSPGPWESFWILFYGFATYGNAGYMREQVCKHMCPYARFQGAMFDKDTLIISYDAARGEPRLRSRRTASDVSGDCVDCTMCVQVCPTGIDIRDGLQIECIGCAACIDACDKVMDKIGSPRGLIRYATERGLQAGQTTVQWRRVLRPRVLVYGLILCLLAGAWLGSLMWLRKPFRVDVIRDRGSLGAVVDQRFVENTYRLQIMNASERPERFTISASGVDGLQVAAGNTLEVPAAQDRSVAVRLRGPIENMQSGSQKIRFHVTAGGSGAQIDERSVFIRPL